MTNPAIMPKPMAPLMTANRRLTRGVTPAALPARAIRSGNATPMMQKVRMTETSKTSALVAAANHHACLTGLDSGTERISRLGATSARHTVEPHALHHPRRRRSSQGM